MLSARRYHREEYTGNGYLSNSITGIIVKKMADADPNPAPGSLLLVQEFVNSLDIEEGTDAIDTPDGLRSWLVAHGLAAASARPTEHDVVRATDVREGLRALLLANNGSV